MRLFCELFPLKTGPRPVQQYKGDWHTVYGKLRASRIPVGLAQALYHQWFPLVQDLAIGPIKVCALIRKERYIKHICLK
jgi:hypothetical protein